ncbi:MAG: hypothetical protein ACKVPX_12040 [Myxococcaceae bacterium]
MPADEIIRRLGAATEPSKWLRNPFSRNHKPYQGQITGSTFKVTRVIHYRNSFLPTVVGSVRSDGTGAVIEATLRLNPFVTAFMALWLGGVTAGAIGMTAHQLSGGKNPAAAVVPALMFVFGYLLMQGGFLFESRKAKRFLEEIASPSHS